MTVPIEDATVHTILLWRADSITLARLRPAIEQIVAFADEPCQNYTTGTCSDYGRSPSAATEADRFCWPCRFKIIRAHLYGASHTR